MAGRIKRPGSRPGPADDACQPARKWTVKELAHEIGLSRSVLAQRFAGLVGEPPMQYLTNWRMQLAKNFMAQPRLSIPQIAAQIGYGSTEAFNRASKRYCGKPPRPGGKILPDYRP